MLVVHIFKKHNHTNYGNTLLTQLIKNAIITHQHINEIMVNFRHKTFATKMKFSNTTIQNNIKPPKMVFYTKQQEEYSLD